MWQLSNQAKQILNASLKEQVADRAIPLTEITASESFINMCGLYQGNAEPQRKDGDQ